MIRIVLLLLLSFGTLAFAFDHDYAAYSETLQKYVADGAVNYEALLHDRAGIDDFLASATEVSFEEYKTFSRARQFAFMINLYNAAAIQLILDNYPVESIRDLGGLFGSVWNKKFINIFEHKVGLGHIEHDILRPEFKDPRVHFAIVCASISCPHLRNEPYTATLLESQLSAQEHDFFTSRPGVNYLEDDILYLSPILKWFADDFGGEAAVRRLAQKYIPGISDQIPIRYSHYNWNLNSKESVN